MRAFTLVTVIVLTLVTLPALADDAAQIAKPAAPATPATSVPTAATPSAPTAPAPATPTAAPVAAAKPPVAAPASMPAAIVAPKAPVAVVVTPAAGPTPMIPPPTAAINGAVAAAAPPAAAAPAAAAEPTLPLRPTTVLTLASEPAPIPLPYKLAFGAMLVGAAVVVWKKRRALGDRPAKTAAVRVLTKTTTGLRGELALVEVGGMRLLIGITPGSMQTLAILPDEASDLVDESLRSEKPAVAALPPQKSEIAARARALFTSLDLAPPAPKPSISGYAASRYAEERDLDAPPDSAPAPPGRAPAPRRRPARETPLEGQARGLALALGIRK